MQSQRKQALRQVFPVHPGGRAEGIPRDSCRMETAHGETRGESDPRLGAGARPLVTFPWELGTVTDGHGSHWHYDQSTLQSILSAEGCVTGPCPSQGMAAEQVVSAEPAQKILLQTHSLCFPPSTTGPYAFLKMLPSYPSHGWPITSPYLLATVVGSWVGTWPILFCFCLFVF